MEHFCHTGRDEPLVRLEKRPQILPTLWPHHPSTASRFLDVLGVICKD
jgi:hypothetical protein